jgi:hypothetical protein
VGVGSIGAIRTGKPDVKFSSLVDLLRLDARNTTKRVCGLPRTVLKVPSFAISTLSTHGFRSGVFVLSCFGFQPISFIKSEQFSSAIYQ